MPIVAPDFEFTPPLTSNQQIVAMLGALHTAHQAAVVIKANEIATAAPANREDRLRLFNAYTNEITQKTKNLLTERFAISDEAKGIGAALDLMRMLYDGIRKQL